MIKKILIANRGEIAVRIIRTCKEMNIETVAIYSVPDAESLHVQLADEAICVGPASSSSSYLNMNNIIEAALQSGCDAIHPGFGFLSENAKFARLIQECDLIFVGPQADIIEKMGNKIKAKEMMRQANIPVIPGSVGIVNSQQEAIQYAQEIGFPLIIKAAAGGGGRGMRVAHDMDEVIPSYYAAKSEAKAAFNNDDVYMEKMFVNTKHIEVQIMADQHGNVLHLYERDCSFQRRHQKMIEETPCHSLDEATRKRIIEDAVKAARFVHYDNVGTIEFLLDQDNNHYFMEMNTRIQVEHPISEMISGVDLIRCQIIAASNRPLPFTQDNIAINGHSIECRINAEDVKNNFAPSPGKIEFVHFPAGRNVRIESAVYCGAVISPFYDSMIVKIIVFGKTRLEAIKKMRNALEEMIVDGVKTNTEFHYFALHHKSFVDGSYTTQFADQFVKELLVQNEYIQ